MISELFISRLSVIHHLNFWTKFTSFLLIFPLTAFVAPAKLLPIIILVLLGVLFFSRVGWKKFWLFTKAYTVSIALGVILLSLLLSPGDFTGRLLTGLVLAVRFALLISFGIFFSMITNPIEIPAGFLQAKIPHKFGITLMVGYRMLPLLSQKIQTVIDAQRSRGANISFSLQNLPRLPLVATSLVIPILHSTLEMSVRLSDALISRGYNPEGTITVPPTKLQASDFILIAISTLLLVASFAKT